MEEEMKHALDALASTVERLAAATTMMEQNVERCREKQDAFSGELARVVAQVDGGELVAGREQELRELTRKLAAAEAQIASLEAARDTAQPARENRRESAGRKTLPVAAMNLLAKQGIGTLDQVEAGTIDAALQGLSIEQRIAVKSHLHRAGWLA